MAGEEQTGEGEEDTTTDVVEIELTQGKVALIDRVDLAIVLPYTYHALKTANTYYAYRWTKERAYVGMHHDIMGGRVKIDHMNGDGLDNRRSNLRLATTSQNGHNVAPRSMSGYKGVSKKSSGCWIAKITVNRQHYYGGMHSTAEDAARAYDKLARHHHGEFAWLNFPDE